MDKEDSASSNSSRTRTRLRHRPFMLLDKFHNRFHSSKKVEATEPVLHKEPSVNRMSLLAEEDEYMHFEDEDMIKYRKGKFTEEEILAEFESIKSSLKGLDDSQGTYKELFQKNNLKRTLIVIGTNIFQQVTGQAFSS